MGLRGGHQLIRQPLIALLGMDNTTVGEGVFGYEMAHDMVIAVGIYAEVGLRSLAVTHYGIKDAMDMRSAGDTMNDVIRGVIEPRAVIDVAIGGIRARTEDEVAHGVAIISSDEPGIATGNVLTDNVTRGITVDPLMGIATLLHDGTCPMDDGHDVIGICRSGRSYLQHIYYGKRMSRDHNRQESRRWFLRPSAGLFFLLPLGRWPEWLKLGLNEAFSFGLFFLDFWG